MQINWPDGITTETFVRDYWQQKPLLIRQAILDFENPITPDEFCGLAMDEDFSSRLIRLGADKKWTVEHGPFTEETLTTLPKQDWSILITDIEKALPDFRSFLDPFRFIPSWRIDDLMISYAPEKASVGAHMDAYDVFLFQASGKREWSITEDPDADLTYIPDQAIRILANFKAQNTWVLEPGDMLYLPPGVPHHGVSMDNECMTWSVGFRAPSHVDFVSDIALSQEALIDSNDRFADPAFSLQDNAGEISPEALANFRKIWDACMQPDAETFARLTGEMLTRNPLADDEADMAPASNGLVEEFLSVAEVWERNSRSQLAFIKQGDKALLFVDGKSFDCSLPLAELVTGPAFVEAEDLARLCGSAEDDAVLRMLLDRGVLLEGQVLPP